MRRHCIVHLALSFFVGIAQGCGTTATSERAASSSQTQPIAPEASTPPSSTTEATPSAAFPDQPFRKKQPLPGTLKPFSSPSIARFTTSQGIKVSLVEQHDLPTVSMTIIFEGGAIDDRVGYEGTADLCTSLMEEGTATLDKLAFNEKLADHASQINVWSSTDRFGIALGTLSSEFSAALALWSDVFLKPGLRTDDFNRLKDRALVQLKQEKTAPTSLASRVSPSIVFGPTHPYGRLDTERSLDAITLKQCKDYLKRRIKSGGATLYVVGDITREQLERELDARFRTWTGTASTRIKELKPNPPEGRFFFVHVPDAKQTVILMTHEGPPRTATDYLQTQVMTSILGGSFSSHINMRVREKHGYAYGAFGVFAYTRTLGYFLAQASVRNDVVSQSLEAIFDEIAMVQEGQILPEEVTREVQGAILRLPSYFSGGKETLRTYQELDYYGLPLDYYDTFVQRMQSITLKEVKASAELHIKPDKLRYLIVGDKTHYLAALQTLAKSGKIGRGVVVELNADGKPIK